MERPADLPEIACIIAQRPSATLAEEVLKILRTSPPVGVRRPRLRESEAFAVSREVRTDRGKGTRGLKVHAFCGEHPASSRQCITLSPRQHARSIRGVLTAS